MLNFCSATRERGWHSEERDFKASVPTLRVVMVVLNFCSATRKRGWHSEERDFKASVPTLRVVMVVLVVVLVMLVGMVVLVLVGDGGVVTVLFVGEGVDFLLLRVVIVVGVICMLMLHRPIFFPSGFGHSRLRFFCLFLPHDFGVMIPSAAFSHAEGRRTSAAAKRQRFLPILPKPS